jgi:hypothetical protein
VDKSLMIKPMPPIATVPSAHILIESQSSLPPGFVASLNNLEHDLKNDRTPKVLRTLQKQFYYVNLSTVI